jgi:hypothetical protein
MDISQRIYFYRPSYLVQKAVQTCYITCTAGKFANMCRQQSTLVTGLTACVAAIGIRISLHYIESVHNIPRLFLKRAEST